MNNILIRDLALRAGLEMCGCGCNMPTRYSAKFAELIINECMQCCDKVDDADDYDGITPDVVTGMRDGALLCKEEIKTHFGIK